MQTNILIIGQGVCGTWLSYWLRQRGADFYVLDDHKTNSATRVASGIINPVTGRRMVKTWMADQLLPFAMQAYTDMGKVVQQTLIRQTELVDFFSSPDRRLSFEKRAQEFETYLEWPEDENKWNHFFQHPFGFGIVSPVLQVNLQVMLREWRTYLLSENKLAETKFDTSCMELRQDSILYGDIKAQSVIFCDGASVDSRPYFRLLPFSFNKGEALIIRVPDLPRDHLFKKTNVITPWQDELFWVGSSYDRDYHDEQPTAAFRRMMTEWLRGFLKIPFEVKDHLASIRPTTVERRPFAGMHPVHRNLGILNGMGTKGVSIAPYLAKQLAEHLLDGKEIMKEADIRQYARILQRAV